MKFICYISFLYLKTDSVAYSEKDGLVIKLDHSKTHGLGCQRANQIFSMYSSIKCTPLTLTTQETLILSDFRSLGGLALVSKWMGDYQGSLESLHRGRQW